MKNTEKIRLVFIPYLLACIASIIGLGLFRWLFEIRFRVIELDETVYLFLTPGIIGLVVALTIVRRRIRILQINWRNRRGYEFYQFYSGFILLGMLAFSQYFIATACYDLIKVNSVAGIDTKHRSRYYLVQNPEISTNALEYAETYTSGKYGQTLNFRMFFACPMGDTNSQNLFWYGVRFHDNISNRVSDYQKESAFKGFIENSRLQFNNYRFAPPIYYEEIPTTGIRSGYYNAIADRFDIPIKKLFILEPQYEPFANRYRNSLIGFLITFGLGNLIFLVMVIRPKVSEYNLEQFNTGQLVINDDLKSYTKYLIPRKPHFETSILIDVILLYHFIIVITGASILSPTTYELYRAGGIDAIAFENGEYWRLVTSMFIHSGIMHLANNLFALGICGYLLEKYMKSYWFTTVFLLCGIMSTFVSLVWHNNSVLVGSSGAIFGLYGVMIAFLIKKIIPFEEKALYFMALIFFAGISMIMGFVLPNVNNAAHVAGLIAGVIAGFFIPTKPDETRNTLKEQTINSVEYEAAPAN